MTQETQGWRQRDKEMCGLTSRLLSSSNFVCMWACVCDHKHVTIITLHVHPDPHTQTHLYTVLLSIMDQSLIQLMPFDVFECGLCTCTCTCQLKCLCHFPFISHGCCHTYTPAHRLRTQTYTHPPPKKVWCRCFACQVLISFSFLLTCFLLECLDLQCNCTCYDKNVLVKSFTV